MSHKKDTIRPVINSQLPQLYIETFGCQMNVNDSEVVVAVMQDAGFSLCREIDDADVIFVNTCSIRNHAEQRIWRRLDAFLLRKKKRPSLIVGVLGCMAKRLKEKILSGLQIML